MNFPKIERTDVDGVPTYWTEGEQMATGTLVFNVGFVDEPASRRGITHLLEHLILSRVDPAHSISVNAEVDATITYFGARGPLDEVAALFRDLCSAIRDLPFAELEKQRTVIATETAEQSPGPIDVLATGRFGLTGIGTNALDFSAIDTLDQATLNEHRDTFFNASNCVFWLTDEPSESFQLDLPQGTKPHRVHLPPYPAEPDQFVEGPPWAVGAGFITRDDLASRVAMSMLSERVMSRLRHELGLSYSLGGQFARTDEGNAFSVVAADALPENTHSVIAALRGLIADLSREGFTEEDLEHDRRTLTNGILDPHDREGILHRIAEEHLIGRAHPENVLIDTLEVTLEEANASFAAAAATALYLVPATDWDEDASEVYGGELGLKPLDNSCHDTREGRTFRSRRGLRLRRPQLSLVINEDGVTMHEGEMTASVDFANVVLLSVSSDGSLVVVDRSDVRLTIHPAAFENGEQAASLIRAGVPAENVHLERNVDRVDHEDGDIIVVNTRLYVLFSSVPAAVAVGINLGWQVGALGFALVMIAYWFVVPRLKTHRRASQVGDSSLFSGAARLEYSEVSDVSDPKLVDRLANIAIDGRPEHLGRLEISTASLTWRPSRLQRAQEAVVIPVTKIRDAVVGSATSEFSGSRLEVTTHDGRRIVFFVESQLEITRAINELNTANREGMTGRSS